MDCESFQRLRFVNFQLTDLRLLKAPCNNNNNNNGGIAGDVVSRW